MDVDTQEAVRTLWEQRYQFGRDRVYEAMMEIWDWQHHDLEEAFGSVDDLASALRAAPAHPLQPPHILHAFKSHLIGAFPGPNQPRDSPHFCGSHPPT
jgi:hypothetical protein